MQCIRCAGPGPFTKNKSSKTGLDARCVKCKKELWKLAHPGPDRRFKQGPKVCPRCHGAGPFGVDLSTRLGMATWCMECNRNKYYRNREYQQKYQRKLRLDAMQHYCGGEPRCMCIGCPLNGPGVFHEFLTFDHIGGGGNAHRKQIGSASTKFVVWLRRNNYPITIQVLCMNCNWASRHSGICPHVQRAVNSPDTGEVGSVRLGGSNGA